MRIVWKKCLHNNRIALIPLDLTSASGHYCIIEILFAESSSAGDECRAANRSDFFHWHDRRPKNPFIQQSPFARTRDTSVHESWLCDSNQFTILWLSGHIFLNPFRRVIISVGMNVEQLIAPTFLTGMTDDLKTLSFKNRHSQELELHQFMNCELVTQINSQMLGIQTFFAWRPIVGTDSSPFFCVNTPLAKTQAINVGSTQAQHRHHGAWGGTTLIFRVKLLSNTCWIP